MRAVGITYLDRKIRSITHTIPRVVLCRGRITAATLFKLKYSSGLGRPIRGQINELIQTFTSEDFPANWYPGVAVRGSIQTVGIIKGAYQATVGVPIAAKAISKTSATSRARIHRARRTKIADLMGKPISEYIGKPISEVAWTEV